MPECAIEAGLHGPDWPGKTLRRGCEREIEPEVEGHDDALVGREATDGLRQRVPIGQLLEWIARARSIVVGSEGDESDSSPATEAIATDVDEDPVEPGLEGFFVAERVCRLPAAFERIADGILSLGATAEEQPRQPVEPIELFARQIQEIDDEPQMASRSSDPAARALRLPVD